MELNQLIIKWTHLKAIILDKPYSHQHNANLVAMSSLYFSATFRECYLQQ